MNENMLKEKLIDLGVLQEGHFLLSSGNHSDKYLQCAKLLQYPQENDLVSQGIAQLFKDEQINLVIGPALGGITLAYEVGRALGTRAIFAERKDGIMQIRRGFNVEAGENVLVVEDVVTTGGSVLEVIDLLKEIGANVIGVASIIDRSAKDIDFPCPFKSLLKMEIKVYPPEECPLCAQSLPIDKPGSSVKK